MASRHPVFAAVLLFQHEEMAVEICCPSSPPLMKPKTAFSLGEVGLALFGLLSGSRQARYSSRMCLGPLCFARWSEDSYYLLLADSSWFSEVNSVSCSSQIGRCISSGVWWGELSGTARAGIAFPGTKDEDSSQASSHTNVGSENSIDTKASSKMLGRRAVLTINHPSPAE